MTVDQAINDVRSTHVRSNLRAEDVLADEVERLRAELTLIRDQDPIENVLDPQWAARIAADALKDTA